MLTAVDTAGCPEEVSLNWNQIVTDDGVGCEDEDEEAAAMIAESHSGDSSISSPVSIFLVFWLFLAPKVIPNQQDFSLFIISPTTNHL